MKSHIEKLKQNSKAGYAESQYELAGMYSRGIDVTQDNKKAVIWYTKAAEQGLAKAQYTLGWMYGHGLKVTKDDELSVKWIRKAADQGHADAQCALGGMYEIGNRVAQDYKEAAKWYKKAAEQGYLTAQTAIELMNARRRESVEQASIDKEFKEEQDKAAAKTMLLKLAPVFADELFRGFDLSCEQAKDIAKRFHECNEIKGWLLFELKRAREEIEL